MDDQEIKLTSCSKSSGCGCKLSSSDLQQIIGKHTDNSAFTSLLVGNNSSDDAAVIQIDDSTALISTIDFFAPIVDSPETYGKISATNAISDIYAMGGRPIMATAVLGWPIGKLPHSMAQKVMQGAKEICTQAGIPLAGGHSIESVEPFFGLSVNGIVHPVQIKRNNTLQEGDRLYLTKPLGTGVLSSGLKRGLIAQEQMADAIDSMCTLNTIGARLAPCKQVHAITDVTGFGLAGHLGEMTASSNLSVQLDFRAIPIFSAAQSLIDQMVYPDITTKNYSHIFPKIGNLGMQEMIVLCDPQTSGGLLISVASTFVETFEKMLVEEGISSPCLVPIGTVVSKQEKEIVIVS